MRVLIETHGCQMNFADTEVVAGLLSSAGVEVVREIADADAVLVNTCAIRENAEEKVLNRVEQLGYWKRRLGGRVVGILGCLAQSLRDELLDAGGVVDFIAGPDSYRTLPGLIAKSDGGRRIEATLSRTETYTDVPALRESGVNAWVSIMRGCDNFCSFCVVPYTRGRERSMDPDAIVAEAERIASAGFVQISLLGQNVNSYHHGNTRFADLMRRVCSVPGIERVRFTSPHPKDFPGELLEVIADEPAACPHVHLPLQSGNDEVLARMERGYTAGEFVDLAHRIREVIPGVAMSSDLIAGFCGETEAQFGDTLAVMSEVRFESAFTFAYSERKNTTASKRFSDDIPRELKHERVVRMVDLQRSISQELHARRVGEQIVVLVEGPSKKSSHVAFGRAPDGIGVVFPSTMIHPGEFVSVVIEESTTNTLIGSAVPDGGDLTVATAEAAALQEFTKQDETSK